MSADGTTDEQIKIAEEYDRWLADDSLAGRWMRYWFSPKRTIFLNTPVHKLPSRLSLGRNDRILDIGCGYGGLLIYLHKRIGCQKDMEGIDASPLMTELARHEISSRGLEDKIKVRQGIGTQLPYSDEAFDAVLSTYVVKHLSDDSLRLMLEEVRRVLKTGGNFCFWEAGPSRIRPFDQFNRKFMSRNVSLVNLRTSDQLRAMVAETGFRNIEPFAHAPYLYYPILPRVGFLASK